MWTSSAYPHQSKDHQDKFNYYHITLRGLINYAFTNTHPHTQSHLPGVSFNSEPMLVEICPVVTLPLGRGGGAISMPRGAVGPTDNDDNMEKPPKVPKLEFVRAVQRRFTFFGVPFFNGRDQLWSEKFFRQFTFPPFQAAPLWIGNVENWADGWFDLHVNPSTDWHYLAQTFGSDDCGEQFLNVWYLIITTESIITGNVDKLSMKKCVLLVWKM